MPAIFKMWRVSTFVGLMSVVACGGDTSGPRTSTVDPDNAFWQLTMNVRAVTLSTVAPYDTIRLRPTPRNAAGVPLTGAVADSVVTVYRNTDPRDSSLVITSDGFVRARYPKDNILVQVRTTVQRITRIDTVLFSVTTVTTPSPLTTISLQVSPDSVTGLLLGTETRPAFTAQALDAHGQPIPDVAVRFSLRDPSLFAIIATGGTSGILAESSVPVLAPIKQTMLIAEATVYGVTMRDSAPVTLTVAAYANIQAVFGTPQKTGARVGAFEPNPMTVRLFNDPDLGFGATVRFINQEKTPIDVVFDDSSAAQGSIFEEFYCGAAQTGNIPAFAADETKPCYLDQIAWKFRVFTVPGTYHYHSALYGTSGTIVVIP